MNDPKSRQITSADDLTTRFEWLLDPPHFIDDHYIELFYNSVIRPEVKREESWEMEFTEETAREVSRGLGGRINIGQLVGGLSSLLGEFTVEASCKNMFISKEKQKHIIELTPVETPQQQLVQLLADYLSQYPSRLFFINDVGVDKDWRRTENITQTPREMVFWDLPSEDDADLYDIPKTKLLPMAIEFSSGRIEVLHNKLRIPKRDKPSWRQYIRYFDCDDCINAVETATDRESGDIRWIDFRVPLSDEKTARLHFEPRGKYHAGKFAHNLIRMSLKHGLRIIGTVKTEPDIHVLAAYRK
ncbi:hypothetical protein [Natrinema caseinilyticum]|uniref:hypothetical protein n=1 Tax=Natrinema caseinilyticum TaxID=2961570 RepID=UPI0020C3829A|nr:hypothetical protein [Natrinema caseinilyticum]